MNPGKSFFFILVLFISLSVYADAKKAKVITESGKKWDVLFLKMSHDTIYLKARKPNGAVFKISGHKSKFRKVDFADGSSLDFSLSDYPKIGNAQKIKSPDDQPMIHDTVSVAPSSHQMLVEGKESITDSSNKEGESASVFSLESPSLQTMVDSLSKVDTASDTMKNAQRQPSAIVDTQAMVSIETNPSSASIEIDGQTVTGTTPFTAKHLSPGPHSIFVWKDSLIASKALTLEKGEMKSVQLNLEKPIMNRNVSVEKKKGRGNPLPLCVLSAISFAGSGVMYYFYKKDFKEASDASNFLNGSSVKGPAADRMLAKYRDKQGNAQTEFNLSAVFLGIGAAGILWAGFIFYF